MRAIKEQKACFSDAMYLIDTSINIGQIEPILSSFFFLTYFGFKRISGRALLSSLLLIQNSLEI
jgi:hypothetical protein